MKNKRRIWGTVIATSTILGAILYFKQPTIKLVAEGEITIYSTLAAATKGEGLIVSKAKKGESFLILNCYDKKSFFVLEVKMSDEKKGFIADGEYRMSGIPDCS